MQQTSQATVDHPRPVAHSGTPCTLHVCTSCRPAGSPREPREGRPGFILFHQLREAVARSALADQVEVQPARCLSVCPRPCGIALSSPDRWTYLFGDQDVGDVPQDIIACVRKYINSPDGFMARADRPKSLRASILGRIPPRLGETACT